eukprot:CAMPEP_0179318820 /NCGR_PEP_ID=MMETSP0797-20121207/57124_1 /TAXON_ID=47934 /ORGANISM="Dinophysis acuminata, Strain DAEP01" /LENGTH=79 /DNA_ID=CAMNT_0021030087 /DNA_START=67 /DNA_END=303 /DNA_ORIENTATION=-
MSRLQITERAALAMETTPFICCGGGMPCCIGMLPPMRFWHSRRGPKQCSGVACGTAGVEGRGGEFNERRGGEQSQLNLP